MRVSSANMSRIGALLLSLWVLLLSPELCAGGVLFHPCDDGPSGGCGHEEDCVDDPCSDVALRPSSLREASDPAPAAIVTVALFSQLTLQSPSQSETGSISSPAHLTEIPQHRSNLPLLI